MQTNYLILQAVSVPFYLALSSTFTEMKRRRVSKERFLNYSDYRRFISLPIKICLKSLFIWFKILCLYSVSKINFVRINIMKPVPNSTRNLGNYRLLVSIDSRYFRKNHRFDYVIIPSIQMYGQQKYTENISTLVRRVKSPSCIVNIIFSLQILVSFLFRNLQADAL